MNREHYVRTLIDAFIDLPDTPPSASPSDSAIAADLHRRGVPLDHALHAIRIAALRRAIADHTLPKISSLAYFVRVLERLRPDDLDADYREHVRANYRRLLDSLHTTNPRTSERSQNAALPRSR
jgi:hypothetical protein